MDLKTKLALALVSACLLSMGALGAFTWVWARGMFLEDAERRLEARAESRRSELERLLRGWEADLDALVARARLAELARDAVRGADAAARARLERVLDEAQAANPEIRRLTAFDADGARVAGSPPDRAGTPLTRDPGYVGARHGTSGVGYVGARHGTSGVGFLVRAPLARGDARLGVVEAELGASALDAIVGPTAEVGDSGQTLVVVSAVPSSGGEGTLILARPAPGSAVVPSEDAASSATEAAMAGREAVLTTVDRSGNEVLAATRFLPEAGLGVVVQVDGAEVAAGAARLLDDMQDLGLALAAFGILGGTLLGFRLARPIQRLVEEVDRIRHGEIGLRLEVQGEDEVAFLAMSLNEFMDQLDRSSDLFQLGELEVLLLDGDARSRGILQDLLENWNMRPTLAESLETALRAVDQARQRGRPFQLILLDESTTDTDGQGLAAALRASDRHPCPIITLSSATTSGAKTAVGRELPKPVIASHLMEAILDEMGVSAKGLASPADVYLRKPEPRKILLAEDSPLIQQVMLGFLEGWGHRVVCAPDGRLAVERARAERFDLVLMDVEMPEMDGLEATAAIRSQEPEGERVPIIALTAEARPGDRERCLASGMNDYIAKPADPKRLYGLINRCPAVALAAAQGAAPEAAAGAGETPLAPEPREVAEAASPVDWELARSLTGGDPALLEEVIQLFPEESRRQLEAIRVALEAADAEAVTRGAHSLKGSAKLFGASTLVDAALAVETLGREGRLEEVAQRLGTLKDETARLVAALEAPPPS
jgi:CheY-like chemotaxis protein